MKPTEQKAAIPGGTTVWLVAILFLALALRILFLFQARDHLFFNAFSDSLYYHQWALRIVAGQHGPQVFYMGPFYPYLLALWYGFFGPHAELFLWFQALLGAVSCGFLFLLGRLVFKRSVGLLAAFMGAIYQVEIFYEGMLLMTTVLFCLHLASLVSLYWALRRDGLWRWGLCGLLLGLSALARASVLAFLPLLLGGVLLLPARNGRGHGGRWRIIAVLLVGCLAVIAPVTLHNYLVGQDAVLLTSNMGMNFFIGNSERATGYYVKPKGLDLTEDIYGTKIANLHAGRGLKPSQVSRFWLNRGLDFIRDRPGAFLRLLARKTLFFWNAYEIPQVENLYFLKGFVPLLRWPLLGFSVLGPLGLLGLALSLGRWRNSYFLLAFVLAIMGSSILFFVISRLRLQACSALLVFAAYALIWIWQQIKERNWRRLAVSAAALAALALFVNWPYSSLDRQSHLAQAFRFHAHHLRETGQLARSAREYQRAIETDPSLADSYVDLATLRMDQEDPEAALEFYQQALRVDPEVSGVHLNFGSIYASQGRWDQAIAEFRRETEVSPYNFKAYESLYRALKERDRSR